ncbi:MAG: hypothetical protein EB121_03300 [Alphaproteobacteria bacterium]|nr:hypothetical protein [Alphaproteobacteria bacterium]NDG04361.1 hypothetical protein [Alphaproteobacteria bacterium]
MVEWFKWSAVVDAQMDRIVTQLRRLEYSSLVIEFEQLRYRLRGVVIKAESQPDRQQEFRRDFAMAFKHILRRLHVAADIFMHHWECSWLGPFPHDTAKTIFGEFDLNNPHGIADGWPRQGYLPWVMRNMVFEQIGFLYQGALKPRVGVSASFAALGYHVEALRALRGKTHFDLTRYRAKP